MKTRRSFLQKLGLAGAGALVVQSAQAEEDRGRSFMIHQVYFWLKDPQNDMKSFMKGCENLIKIDSIQKAYIGVPAATERREVVDHSFHVSLTVHFKSIEDHNIYQFHEDHTKFVADHEDKWKKVQVYDSKID